MVFFVGFVVGSSTKSTHTPKIVHRRRRHQKKSQSNCVLLHINRKLDEILVHRMEYIYMCIKCENGLRRSPLAGSSVSIADMRLLLLCSNSLQIGSKRFWANDLRIDILPLVFFDPKGTIKEVFRFSFSTATIWNETHQIGHWHMNICILAAIVDESSALVLWIASELSFEHFVILTKY